MTYHMEDVKAWLAVRGYEIKRKRAPRAAKPKRRKYLWYKRPTWGRPGPSTASTFAPRWCIDKRYLNDQRERTLVLEHHTESMAMLHRDAKELGIHFPHRNQG